MTEKDLLIQELRRKLKAYEDTGLTPEQICGLRSMEQRASMAKMLRWEEAEKDGRLIEQKAIPGNDVWIVARDVYGLAYDVSGFMFLAQVGDYVILSAYIHDLDDLGSTMAFHAWETVDDYDTPLAVFPAADCYLTREEAEAALEGGTDNAD